MGKDNLGVLFLWPIISGICTKPLSVLSRTVELIQAYFELDAGGGMNEVLLTRSLWVVIHHAKDTMVCVSGLTALSSAVKSSSIS